MSRLGNNKPHTSYTISYQLHNGSYQQ